MLVSIFFLVCSQNFVKLPLVVGMIACQRLSAWSIFFNFWKCFLIVYFISSKMFFWGIYFWTKVDFFLLFFLGKIIKYFFSNIFLILYRSVIPGLFDYHTGDLYWPPGPKNSILCFYFLYACLTYQNTPGCKIWCFWAQ